ncbi:MAG TPA: hypothetical protein VH186_06370 [Chloroflexia bacterium]|nr:hypothetical protein [Chloroflexia bacterium]
MSKGPSNNPLVQQLQLLLTGYGYNFYDKKNQARADDLLVRQKASNSLEEAAQALSALERDFQRQFIPPLTRESPFPSQEILNEVREITRLRERISALASRIRGMPVPTQDRTWWRYREEQATLQRLLELDYYMVWHSNQVAGMSLSLTPSGWRERPASRDFEQPLQILDTIVRDRQHFLEVTGR